MPYKQIAKALGLDPDADEGKCVSGIQSLRSELTTTQASTQSAKAEWRLKVQEVEGTLARARAETIKACEERDAFLAERDAANLSLEKAQSLVLNLELDHAGFQGNREDALLMLRSRYLQGGKSEAEAVASLKAANPGLFQMVTVMPVDTPTIATKSPAQKPPPAAGQKPPSASLDEERSPVEQALGREAHALNLRTGGKAVVPGYEWANK